ncbi:MAG: TatD family hydrolase [Acidilobaceae archaeon]
MLQVADAHLHSNPIRGFGAKVIAEKFKQAGGWFMALVSLSPTAYNLEPPSLESYIKAIDLHILECRRARESKIKVMCISGFHPADVDKLIDYYGLKPLEVLNLAYRVIDEIASRVKEGLLDGIGEVGRQHYKTSSVRILVSEYILEKAIALSRDLNIPVHMHLEQEGEATVHLVDIVASRLGAYKHKLLFHHADPKVIVEASKRGYPSSIAGIPKLIEYAITNLNAIFMFESDYLDDPKRPGVVAYPWVMAENIIRIAREHLELEEKLYKINVDNIIKLYGIE